MYSVRKLDDDLFFIGVSDRRIALFENVYPVPDGVSYNSYFISDEKTCVIDTVDKAGEKPFKENIAFALAGRDLDYIVVNHMEPDHSATLEEILIKYPHSTVVCNAKIAKMIENYFTVRPVTHIVKEGDTLSLGKHVLRFIDAPMVHWPEVMMTYDDYSKTLFSADAFGSFGALSGNLYADKIKYKGAYTDEMRRYYTNIVGKYGAQVQAVLKKAASLDIKRICPLHGLIWRSNIDYLLEKYGLWSSYSPEKSGVLVAYASVYGNTENAAEILAAKLDDKGVPVAVYDVSKTDASYLIAEAFKYSHVVLASTTYNAGIFVNMENFLSDLIAHGIANRAFAVIENGSWAPTAGKLIKEKLSTLKNCRIIGETVKILSSVKDETLNSIESLADEIAAEIAIDETSEENANGNEIDKTAFFKLSYGLYVLTAKGEKDNGCIVNTVIQLTDSPKRIAVAVNKANYTRDLIAKTKTFNACIISEKADFSLFERFGFKSGRNTDKFDGFDKTAESANGLKYITENTCGYISAKVIAMKDFGTHTLFIGEVDEAKTLSDEKPMTYEYYFAFVKPQPKKEEKKKGYVCKICGFVYEGEELPPDYVCPICKHGADDFEKL